MVLPLAYVGGVRHPWRMRMLTIYAAAVVVFAAGMTGLWFTLVWTQEHISTWFPLFLVPPALAVTVMVDRRAGRDPFAGLTLWPSLVSLMWSIGIVVAASIVAIAVIGIMAFVR
jgi:hypothetical protein